MTYQRLLNFILAFYIILKPFYLWSSGLPQIADLLLVVFIVIAIFKIRIPKTIGIPHFVFSIISILFLGYVVFINSIWFIVTGYELGLLKNTVFYVFNVLAMLVAL